MAFEAEIGVVGLGVMGRNLLLNLAENGFAAAGWDQDPEKRVSLEQERQGLPVFVGSSLAAFLGSLGTPRTILILVPAGNAVDAVIDGLLPLLSSGDTLIDGGNSHFQDTDRRAALLASKGLAFIGMGVSGGEAGARHGPSLMPGGDLVAFNRIESMLRKIAAKVNGSAPCVAYLGSGSAGHYVKMVHNGIEYALMQQLSETYDLMKTALGLNAPEISEVYKRWTQGPAASYLVEISASVTRKLEAGEPLVDKILDVAGQKGTGKWTSEDALELGIPIPSIDAAVAMRHLSRSKTTRACLARRLGQRRRLLGDEALALGRGLEAAYYAASVLTYAQGFALLNEASSVRSYQLDFAKVARVWRGGCIIRSAVLEPIASAYDRNHALPHLLLDPVLETELLDTMPLLRKTISCAVTAGVPVPGLMASLSYFDAMASEQLPLNLVQAQRDCFGAHGYARIDREGHFHSDWERA